MHTDLWSELCRSLEQGQPLAIATIATSDGSTPRSAGAKMLVGGSGLIAGTLGGGLAEAKALEIAAETLADGKSRLFGIDMGGSASTGADLICGGMVKIFVQRAEPATVEIYQALRERLRRGRDSFLMTPLAGWGAPILVRAEAMIPELADVARDGENCARIVTHRGAEFLWEPFPARARLILAGGGHVSLAAAQMAAMVDFEVTVLDDRREFANPERFPWLPASRIKVAPEFRDCLTESVLGFPVGPNCCIAILTRGHSYDSEVLTQALATPAGYVGMIGSRRKRDSVYDLLRAQGIRNEQLDRVHSPIGIPLGGETPEEIAVSIVAELISARAKGLGES